MAKGTQIGGYTILGEIGAGGWGIVYKAMSADNRIVALKEFYPQSIAHRSRHGLQANSTGVHVAYESALKKFREEGNLLAKVNHRSIVKVYEYFEQDQTGFLAMAFVEGNVPGEPAPNLNTVALTGQSMPPADVKRLADELMNALEVLHARQIVHRDIAPDNILMAGLRNDEPMIIDLGGARSVAAFLSSTMEALVKPGFTPIEQYAANYAQQKPPEASADIYATSAVLYRVITGTNPVEAVLRAVGHDLDPPLDPGRFEAFDPKFLFAVSKGLSLDARERPQTIAQWRTLMSEGGSAGGDSGPGKRKPWPLAVKFALIALACLVIGLIIGTKFALIAFVCLVIGLIIGTKFALMALACLIIGLIIGS